MPKPILVFLVLFGGVLFIFISDPPHTPCNLQVEEFQKRHTAFFSFEESVKFKEKTEYQRAFESCRESNRLGGCIGLFNGVKDLVETLEITSSDCLPAFCKQNIFHQPLWDTLGLLASIAWGDRPPESFHERQGWLEDSHVLLFCRLKRVLMLCDGQEKWNQFLDETLNSFPERGDLSRREAWELSLFSISCDQIL